MQRTQKSKWAKDSNRLFPIINLMKICSTSPAYREIRIKIMSYHFTSIMYVHTHTFVSGNIRDLYKKVFLKFAVGLFI